MAAAGTRPSDLSIVNYALTLEYLESQFYAQVAASGLEARDAATLNTLLRKSPTPQGAFAKPMTMRQVLAVIKPFIA